MPRHSKIHRGVSTRLNSHPVSPISPVVPMIPEKATDKEKTELLADYDDDLDCAHHMCLCTHYDPTGQSTYIAAICQEQLLQQGDATMEKFFAQMSVVWLQLDPLGPQLSPSTYDPTC